MLKNQFTDAEVSPQIFVPSQRLMQLEDAQINSYNFVLIHGAWHSNDSWGPLREDLERRGHGVISPNLPIEDIAANFNDDAAVIEAAVNGHGNLFFVGHSRGGEIIPRVIALTGIKHVIGIAAINSGGPHSFRNFSSENLASDEVRYTDEFIKGITITDSGMSEYDPDQAVKVFYHDVHNLDYLEMAIKSLRQQRPVSQDTTALPPLPPELPAYAVLSTYDRVHNLNRARAITTRWLNTSIIDFQSGHTPQLAKPNQLADLLITLADKAALKQSLTT